MKLKEFVSYAGHGIGQITEVKVMHGVEFFSIEILDSGLKIMIPKSSTSEMVRPLMNAETAKLCLKYMRGASDYKPEYIGANWKRWSDKMIGKIKSNEPLQLAEVVAELNLKDKTELSFGERKIMDAAKCLLEREIGLVLK